MRDVETAKIYASENARPLIGANVERLAASIKLVGLLNPIIVKPSRRFHGGIERDVFDIVAGRHRFEAVRQLGWTEVSCKVIDQLDDLHIELVTIDENLARQELSDAQRASQFCRRKEIYEALHPETVNGATGERRILRQNGEVSHADRFSKATADATGQSERSIQRAVARGEALGGDIERVQGTSLDKAVELDALAKMPEAERGPLIDRARAGEVVSARPFKPAADAMSEVETKEKWLSRGMSWWNTGCQEWREEFCSRIDQPVMDQRFG